MEDKDNTTSVFTYIWTLENSPALLFSAPVESPVFQVESVEKTKWCLGIWTSKEDIYFYVQREKEDNGPDSIGIDFEIAVLSVDGSPLIEKIDKKEFKRSEYVKLEEFAKNDEVFAKRRKEFLPKDILTVRCRMWKSDTKVSSADLCFANTRLGIDRQTFLWTIREFSNFKVGQRKTHYLKSTAKTGPELYLTLFLTQKDGEEYVEVKVDRGFVEKKFFISGEISLLNVDGKVEYAREIEDWFSSPKRNFYEFEEFITIAKLMENKTSLLPNDVLCLKCVFEICLGEVSSHIEYIFADNEQAALNKTETRMICCPLKKALIYLYENGLFSDVNLKSGSTSFAVHKNILGVRSAVLRATFENEPKGKNASKSIDIPDMDPDTLRRMLLYIYTDTMEDLLWDSAFNLYKAAHRYGLLALKKYCSAFLKAHFSISCACSALVLADEHHDEDLTQSVQEFMLEHDGEMFTSEEWKSFKLSNVQLAIETIEQIYLKRIQNSKSAVVSS